MNIAAATSQQQQPQNTTAKLFVTIPYPDQRQQHFGTWCGRANFNFSIEADRVEATQCWTNVVVERLASLPNNISTAVELVGFYWYLESVPSVDDRLLIQAVTAHVHDHLGLKIMWIPDFNSRAGLEEWTSLGFDFATLQPNYAFQNATLDRFSVVNEFVDEYVGGIEMELPLVVRNPVIDHNATASFEAYVAACYEYGWSVDAIKTYYEGNDFATMAPNVKDAEQQALLRQLFILTNMSRW